MDEDKKKALEEDGWVFGNAEDFLDLTPEEIELLEKRIANNIVIMDDLRQPTEEEKKRYIEYWDSIIKKRLNK